MIICWKTVKLSKEKFFSSVLSSHGNMNILYQMRGSQKLQAYKFLMKGG